MSSGLDDDLFCGLVIRCDIDFNWLHLHAKSEHAPAVSSIRLDLDHPGTTLHNLLDDVKTETNAWTILVSDSVKLAKLIKQVRQVFFLYTFASVLAAYLQA